MTGRVCRLILVPVFMLLFPVLALAGGDEIELKDGSKLQGDVIAKNAFQLYLSTKDGVKKVDMSNIRKINFGPGTIVSSISENPPRTGTIHTSQDIYLNPTVSKSRKKGQAEVMLAAGPAAKNE